MTTSVRNLKIVIDEAGNGAKGIKNLAGSIGGIAKIAAAAALGATIAIGAIGVKLISMGSDAEEMLGKFNVVFGKQAGSVTEQLASFGRSVGRGKFELQEMASALQDTFVPMGFAREEAAKMSVEMTKLAVDVGSFNNISDAQVMKDFQSALVGNTETVRKYGIVINQARIKAKAFEMGLVGTEVAQDDVRIATERVSIAQEKLNVSLEKHGEGSTQARTATLRLEKAQKALEKAMEGTSEELTEQDKLLAIQQMIIEGSSDAMGDAERTSGSWANQLRRLKSIITDTATEMGLKLLPVLTPLLTNLGNMAEKVMPIVIEKFAWFAESVLPKATEKVGQLSSFFGEKLIPTIRIFYEDVIKPASEAIAEFGRRFKEAVQPAVEAVTSLFKEDLIPAIKDFYENTIRPAIPIIREFAMEIGERLLKGVADVSTWFAENLRPALVDVSDFITVTLIPAVRKFNEDTIRPFIQTVKDWVAEFREKAIPVMARLNRLVDVVLKPALKSFKESWEKIKEVFGGASKKGEETGKVISDIDIILAAFEGTVSLGIHLIGALAGTVEWVARALHDMKRALGDVAEGWEKMKQKAREAIDAIPPWLRPGSPTPFELGLKGIGSALKEVNLADIATGRPGGGSPGFGGGGGGGIGGGITVVFNYSPAISLADKREAEDTIAPMLENILRRRMGVV